MFTTWKQHISKRIATEKEVMKQTKCSFTVRRSEGQYAVPQPATIFFGYWNALEKAAHDNAATNSMTKLIHYIQGFRQNGISLQW